ncbi:hypothetical protein E0Z10_g2431 [Xylaria hypoxylon]|uniref:Lytic polysaccharide monooxygenase n=1 Tax=Xylaria hypoxylon TaxID=37992 RepID=A0A4Z0ZA22_9PEZI|nr:hypothetical protein E0Z10_g2431 [Xylaria hypoxylon]
MMPSCRSFLLAATLASLSAAHVSLENPKPYKFVGDGKTNPVSSTGSDFPCRIPPGQSYIIDGEPTPMTIGEDQTLSFSGHAVHGGGSCQLALSRGFPTKDSPWMVIHSIEGGCPARNQKGNLEGPNEDKYIFQIPEGIEPGTNWTLAWTWASRVGGGPEFYMNCSPITILPGKKKRMSLPDRREALSKRHDDFPELFMANMGELGGGCTTSDALRAQIPIAYPNPGASVERPEGDNLFKQPCDGNPRAKKSPAAGADDGDRKTPQVRPSTAASFSSSNSVASSSSTSSSTTVHSSTSQSNSDSTLTTVTTITPTVTMLFPLPYESAPTMPSASASAEPCSCASPASATPCTEGHLTCLDDGTHFATCTGGKLTAPQPIAPGYKCQPGSGLGLETLPL